MRLPWICTNRRDRARRRTRVPRRALQILGPDHLPKSASPPFNRTSPNYYRFSVSQSSPTYTATSSNDLIRFQDISSTTFPRSASNIYFLQQARATPSQSKSEQTPRLKKIQKIFSVMYTFLARKIGNCGLAVRVSAHA